MHIRIELTRVLRTLEITALYQDSLLSRALELKTWNACKKMGSSARNIVLIRIPLSLKIKIVTIVLVSVKHHKCRRALLSEP